LTISQTTDGRVKLSVCSLCTDTSCSGEAGVGGGATLLNLLRSALDKSANPEIVDLQPTRCLMGCTEGCLVSIAEAGKMQYLLGRLPAQPEKAAMVAEFAVMYADSTTGVVPNHEWPGDLALHFIGRIPPLEPCADGDWSGEGCDL
jgi:predicted metal-binding protein